MLNHLLGAAYYHFKSASIMQIFDDSKQKAWGIGNIDRELLIKR